MKAHEISKVMNITFKELKEIAQEIQIIIKSPNQKLTDDQIVQIEERLNKSSSNEKSNNEKTETIKEESIKSVEIIEKPTEEITKIEEPKKENEIKEIELTLPITVDSLAEALEIHPNQVIQILFSKGHLISKNSTIEPNLAEEVAIEFNT
ncbi:MAG: translation initiation factor IF-2 N-terminal domain-containing protein, partial [bacterium]|nr:translation initiation factor IF-2 N-terminal domain-containing protein [bacterium]